MSNCKSLSAKANQSKSQQIMIIKWVETLGQHAKMGPTSELLETGIGEDGRNHIHEYAIMPRTTVCKLY